MTENARPGEDTGNETVVKAFRTILDEILGGELKVLQHAVTDLDTQTSRRMQTVEERTAAIPDDLRKELQSMVEERFVKIQQAEQDRKKALFEHETRIDKAVAELKEQFQQSQRQQESRVDSLKGNLEHTLSSSETKLEATIETLSQNVAGLQLELQQQVETSQRMSALFDTMAAVFNGPTQQPGMAVQPASQEQIILEDVLVRPSESTKTSPAQSGETNPAEANGSDLEVVLENVFPKE